MIDYQKYNFYIINGVAQIVFRENHMAAHIQYPSTLKELEERLEKYSDEKIALEEFIKIMERQQEIKMDIRIDNNRLYRLYCFECHAQAFFEDDLNIARELLKHNEKCSKYENAR